MKAHLLITALLATLAHANQFPPAPSLNELVVVAVKIRKVKAPYYAENPTVPAKPSVGDLAQSVEKPVLERFEAMAVMKLPKRPDTPEVEPDRIQSLAKVLPERPEITALEPSRLHSLAKALPERPDISKVGPVSLRTLVPIKPGNAPEIMATASVVDLPGIEPLMLFDPFTLKLQFIWEKPHGQWMNQLLKDIAAAKTAGDIETYNALTARYAAWAEKYLRRDNPPDLDGQPGR